MCSGLAREADRQAGREGEGLATWTQHELALLLVVQAQFGCVCFIATCETRYHLRGR